MYKRRNREDNEIEVVTQTQGHAMMFYVWKWHTYEKQLTISIIFSFQDLGVPKVGQKRLHEARDKNIKSNQLDFPVPQNRQVTINIALEKRSSRVK